MSELDQLAIALAAAQAKMTNAAFNKVNPHFKSKYADLAAIRDATIPHLSANGLAIVQFTSVTPEGNALLLHTKLIHKSGQFIEGAYPVASGTPQAMGSALTYAKRYSWASMCGISAEDDDDATAAEGAAKNGRHKVDPQAPLNDGPITKAQLKELVDLADEVDADKAKFCKYLGIPSLADMPAYKFQQARDALEAKRSA